MFQPQIWEPIPHTLTIIGNNPKLTNNPPQPCVSPDYGLPPSITGGDSMQVLRVIRVFVAFQSQECADPGNRHPKFLKTSDVCCLRHAPVTCPR